MKNNLNIIMQSLILGFLGSNKNIVSMIVKNYFGVII